MVQISGTNARFLRTPVILSEIMRVMEPNLVWLGIIPFVDTGGVPVVYGVRNAKTSDIYKQTPILTTPSATFAEVQISRLTKQTAITQAEGLSIRFDKSALNLPAGRDMIVDGFQTVGYWLAEYLNSMIYTALDGGSTDAGITPAAVWSDTASAKPTTDCLNFANAMIREGYPYRLSDIYVDSTNFNEMEAFLISSDRPVDYNAALGRPNMDLIRLPSGQNLHRMISGMTHGDIFGLDATNQTAAALYYHNDPNFSTPSTITYERRGDNGGSQAVSVQNFGLNTYQYFEDDTHDTVVQLWFDTAVKVKDAYGFLSDNGI